MSIKKLEDGRYELDIRPRGAAGKRIRRKFTTKAEAVAFERYTLSNFHDKEWLAKPADKRSLSDLIDLWWIYEGRNHKYGPSYRSRLDKINREMGFPRAFMLNRNFLITYRAGKLQKGLQASGVNRDLCVLSGMFSVLIEAEEFHTENPLHAVRKLRVKNKEMSFLDDAEISALLRALDGDNRKVAILCLSTGARWSEAADLRAEHVVERRITFIETKNGKKRSIPISQEVADIILSKKTGRLFGASYGAFCATLKAIKPDLPKGQATHALRHTFATHFMMRGGNIITLQRILGHATIQQTMTYAHFAPDFLQEAIDKNPLSGSVHIVSMC